MAVSFQEPEFKSLLLLVITLISNIGIFVYIHCFTNFTTQFFYSTNWKISSVLHITQLLVFLLSLKIIRRIAAGGKFKHELLKSGKLSVVLKNSKTSEVEVKDKVVVITGGNTGIGFATALNFARFRSKVYIACRDEERGNKAAEELRKQSKNDSVEFLKLDLASFESIREFEKNWKSANRPNIDILINNAGIMMCPFALTKDGFELQFGTNHLGHFLFTKLLLPHINQESGRIINLSSFGHSFAPKASSIDYFSLNEKNKAEYNSVTAYGISKLCNIYFTRQLQKLLSKKNNIIVTAVHPGGVNTELGRHFNPLLLKLVTPIALLLMKTPNEGCQTSLFCSLHPEIVGGEYYSDCNVGFQTSQTRDENEWKRLWDASEQLTSHSLN